MNDWVEQARLKRISEGEAKYGAWTSENFRSTGRSGINEAIPECLDMISYLEMAYMMKENSAGEFKYYEAILTDICERLKRRIT